MEEIIVQHTEHPVEMVAMDMERDYYVTAAEAVEYGIIDTVLTRRLD